MLVLPEEGAETTFVYADAATFRENMGDVRVRGNVRIERGNTVAEADSAILDREDRRLELRGRPVVTQGASRIRGREIDLFFGEKEVERVAVRRGARLNQTRTDTLLIPDPNAVRGDSAVMYFDRGVLQRAVVSGRASSTFVPAETREDRISLNEALADSIIMLFKDDEADEVIFIGNASGTYRFYEGDIDSLKVRRTVDVDTVFGVVRADTTRFDFRRQAEIVEYSAERILYLTSLNDLHLQDAAEVHYQNRTLRAGKITFDADTDLLTARERPVLIEGGDRIYGEKMGYDMERRDAWVAAGATEYDQGYYRGERILRMPDGTLQVENGQYTSCNLARPHYGFRSREMKIYLKDKAIGRPVWLYLGNIPTLYLPFFFNSVDPGRRSGFLQPDIEFGVGGRSRYIRGLDYYWAASDYWDVLFSSEYNERNRVNRSSVATVLGDTADTRNVRFSANLRYKLRYNLEGNIRYSRSDDLGSDRSFVTLGGRHSQTLSERMTLRGNLDYASNDFAVRVNNENTSFERARQRQLTSTLTFSRRGALANTTVNLRRVQIVSPDESFTDRSVLTQTMPSLSLRFRSIRLAPRPKNPRTASWAQKFLSDLQFAPNLNFSRTVEDIRRQRLFHIQTGEELPDTTTVADSLIRKEFFTEDLQRITASTSLGLSRQSSLWFLSVTPAMSYSESYTDDDRDPKEFSDRFTRSLRASLGASTVFYGIFQPRIGRLRALRHSIEPRATYAYSAALSGRTARHSVSMSLRNQVDLKYDKEGEERRLDGVIEWRLSTSYDPDRAREWSNISSSLSINRQGPLRMTMSQVYDPYAGKIISTSIPFALRLSGDIGGYAEPESEGEQLNRVAEEEGARGAPQDSVGVADQWGFVPRVEDGLDTVEGVDVGEGGGPLGWELGMSYSLRRQNGRNVTSNVALSAGIRPTRKWRIAYRANFDARTRELTNPSIRVERDLHCWRASFSRVFSGFANEWRYYFRIHVIQHQDDLFYESGDRSYGF
ncbi:MAG: putative LPS assembly protein LptD [Candidatus Krumholzibacteriia bacterium]